MKLALAFAACGLLFAQNFDEIQAERAATGLQYADGMAWAREGFLVFADVGKKKIYRLDPGIAPKPTEEDNNGAQGIAYDSQGRLYICEPFMRRVVRLDRKAKLETVTDAFEGKKFNAPNDVIVRKDGQVYFTDPAFASQIDSRELDFNGVYHVNLKGEIEAVARWKTRPNGIALSPDGKVLYVSDSDRHAVVAFDLDGRGGAANPRDVITKIEGVPNGMRTDVNGRLYIGAKGLDVYSPDGKLLHRLLPNEIVTNCAFGDNDFETLYASGRKIIYRIRLGVKGALQY
ncbi:MAG TPA: SMP-30/gluconolactonase/LRE family protein [Bryobacteraceae bacterium]|nr:SMP-30/gluconolactonase/LRE family protein [Bryobacteraceae bacterium]